MDWRQFEKVVLAGDERTWGFYGYWFSGFECSLVLTVKDGDTYSGRVIAYEIKHICDKVVNNEVTKFS